MRRKSLILSFAKGAAMGALMVHVGIRLISALGVS